MQPYYGHLIRILHWCTDQTMTAALEKQELTSAQGHIMGYLSHRKEPPCPRDIEEAFHLSHPTVSGLLSRLEQKGFLRLCPDPEDRRCKRILLEEKGRECHGTMHRIIQGNENRMLQDFTPEEKKQFAVFLQRAIANMGVSSCQCYNQEDNNA